jgi:hypothetical protein
MHRTRKSLQSTRKPSLTKDEDANPPLETQAANEIFCFVALTDNNKGTIYTDLPGKFPVRSFQGHQYIFLTYVYDINAILVRPMESRKKASMEKAFKDIYSYLTMKNFKPKLHIMDNECSKTIKTFIQEQGTKIKFVKPHIHRVNAAERAIQTFKNHFIAGLCTVNKLFPIQLWNELLPQAELTVNLLRTSCLDPNMSAYAMLEGEYNFDHTPVAPPGTRAMVYDNPKDRTTWGTHADDAWYVGPTPQHHRCYKFFMPHTKGFCVAQTAKFYPTNCKMPA